MGKTTAMKFSNQAGYAKGRAAMPEIMALNNKSGSPKNLGAKPKAPNVQKFADGGVVKNTTFAKGGKVKHDDAAQDRQLIKSIMNKELPKRGPKMNPRMMARTGFAVGGAAKIRKASPTPKPIRKGSLVGGVK